MTTLAEIRAAVGDWLVERMELEFTPAEQRLYDALRLPVDGVIVTPDSLAVALLSLPDINVEWYAFPDRRSRSVTLAELCAAVVAALAAEGGPS